LEKVQYFRETWSQDSSYQREQFHESNGFWKRFNILEKPGVKIQATIGNIFMNAMGFGKESIS